MITLAEPFSMDIVIGPTALLKVIVVSISTEKFRDPCGVIIEKPRVSPSPSISGESAMAIIRTIGSASSILGFRIWRSTVQLYRLDGRNCHICRLL